MLISTTAAGSLAPGDDVVAAARLVPGARKNGATHFAAF